MADESQLEQIAQLDQQVVQLYEQGQYQQALPIAIQALALAREVFGPQHPDVATSLNNLAKLYRAQDASAQAAPLYQRALAIREEVLGPTHPDVATSLNNLAGLYQAQGAYAQAEPLYQRALAIREEVLGPTHPDVATSLNNLAGLYVATDRETDALTLMEKATTIDNQMISQVFSISSESRRKAYLQMIEHKLHMFLSLVSLYFANSPPVRQIALDLVLQRKALGVEALAAQRDAILGGQYHKLEPQFKELTQWRERITQKTLAGPGQEEGLAAHQQQLADWNNRKEQLEAELARQIPEMRLEQRLRAAGRQAVARTMPLGVTLVEVVRFPVFDFQAVPARGERHWQPARYAAFVLRAGEPDTVQMVDLGEAAPIDQLISHFRDLIVEEGARDRESRVGKRPKQDVASGTDRIHADRLQAGQALRTLVFDPVQAAIGESRQVLLAPGGDLTRLPFDVLPLAEGQLLGDAYHMSYLSTGRDVVRFGAAASAAPAPAIVIADPDFDLASLAIASAPTEYALQAPALPHTSSQQSHEWALGGLSFERLPGTHG